MLLSPFGQRQEGLKMRSHEAVSSMLCPVCRTGLSMSDRSGVEIDYCPSCRGVWLDRGELDKIIERTAAPVDRGDNRRPGDDRSRSSGGLMDMAASMLQGDDRRHDRYYDKHRPKKKKSLLSEFFD